MVRARPLLLVDIDGVLNVYGVEACPDGYREYDLFPEDDDPTRLATVHGDWLTELGGVFDLVWASAWGIRANELIAPILRIRPLPFVPMPEIPFPARDKVPAIDAYVGDMPVAWLDDVVVDEAVAWASERTASTLLVEVDHRGRPAARARGPTPGLGHPTLTRRSVSKAPQILDAFGQAR